MRAFGGSFPRVLSCLVALGAAGSATTLPALASEEPEEAASPTAATTQRLLTPAEQAALASVVRTSTGPLPALASGPSPQAFDIGEHCLAYRYADADHCNENQLADCQDATSEGDCGIQLPFTLTNTWCQVMESSGDEVDNIHVWCQGYVPSGPLPQPQCPDGHVLGDYGQDCAGSCTEHCDDYCNGGYCTGGAYDTCYLQYQPLCDCGTINCPPTGPP